MITQKTLTETLPGYQLVNNNGTIEIRNPSNEAVASYDKRRAVFEIDGDHPDHEMVIVGMERTSANIEINRKPKPEPPKKAINWGNAGGFANSLKGSSGTGGAKTTIEYKHDESRCYISTNNYQLARELVGLFVNERRAEFTGNYGKRLTLILPTELCRQPKEIILGI